MKQRHILNLGLVAGWLAMAAVAGAATIRGSVMRSNGDPIPDATVYVYTAKPRVGPGITCPSCYADCGKSARTDDEGNFAIPSVAGDLVFNLVVMAKGYRPQIVTNVDPLLKPARARLSTLKLGEMPPEQQITGKVIDPYGKGVAGAVFEVGGLRIGSITRFGGSVSAQVDPMAVTDENGEFVINCTNGVEAVTLTLQGPSLAKRRLWLEPGKSHLLRMDEGVNVTGRLLRDGVPIVGATVAMVTQDGEASVFMRGFEVATDEKGRFNLRNVPANNRYYFYAKMRDMQAFNLSVPRQAVSTGKPGTQVKLGDLKLEPAYTIRGRVVMSDGSELPDRTRIHFGREDAWDYEEQLLGENGRFEFKAVPAESVSLSVRVKGYRISARNPNKDWLNEGRLVGRVSGDIDDFVIELEFGDAFPPEERNRADAQPRNKPLQGAPITP
jgi:hypothetical protein